MEDERKPRADALADALRAGRGPQGLLIPGLGEKLERLLALAGRNQAWLAACLNLTPPAVTNWKRQGRLPALHAQVACRLLGIDLETLLDPDLARFRSAVDAAFAPGSGRRWRTLVRGAPETAEGLRLLVEERGASPCAAPLKAVVFARDPASRLARPRVPQVTLEQRIRFALPVAAVAGLGPAPRSFALCIEDPRGWAALCPNSRGFAFEEAEDRWWLPPPGRKALDLEDPPGAHKAVAVVASAVLPNPVADAFRAGNVEWAGDALAAWLANEAVAHVAFALSFNVVAA